MSEILTPDICVIGAGSGGLTVAAAAASFGVEVVLIEKGKMGGDCLNYGCVPSKALLAAGKQAKAIKDAVAFGVSAENPKIDFRAVNKHVQTTIAAIAPNDSVERFTALGVNVIEGAGKFIDKNTVIANDKIIKARRFVISTGSSPFVPPIPGLDKVAYFTNENIFINKKKPAHLIIIGAGPIGMEMAQAHMRLGSKVTVVEGFKALAKDDPELTAIVLEKLNAEGLNLYQGAAVTRIEKRQKSGIRVHFKIGEAEQFVDGSNLFVATGRAVNVDGLGLQEAGISFDRKGIKVKNDLRTTNRKVYAIGDVAGGLQFTHVAGYHAGLVIRGILFRMKAKPDNHIIPWVTYTDPEIAHVGLTEEEAFSNHKNVQVLRWPYHENDRAQAERKTTGLVKILTNKKGKILGVSIAGSNAGELINMWALAISKQMSVKDIAGYIPPYPTMSEIGKRAAITYYAPFTSKPWVRNLIGFLRKFG